MTTSETAAAANDWEAEVGALLQELSNVQGELLEVLGTKRDRMAAGDLEGMQQLQEQEEQLCERLNACHERRADLLKRAEQQGMPGDSIGNLAKSLSTGRSGELVNQVNDAARRVHLLQQLSLTNWVLAQRSLLHVSQLLEIVATGGRLKPTYGNGDSNPARGALMDQEA